MNRIIRNTDIKSALKSRQGGFLMNPFRMAPAAESDPHFANVTHLLHMDGADGGTTFTDSGPLSQTITRVGTPTTSATQKLYGATSLVVAGGANYLTAPSPVFGSSLWTVELAYYMAVAPAGDRTLISIGGAVSNYSNIRIEVRSSRKVYFWVNLGGGVYYFYEHATALDLGVWHKVALVRHLIGQVSGYVNGTRVWIQGIPTTALGNTGAAHIGSGYGDANSFNGFIDEVRITKVVRYTAASYTLATKAFPDI